MRQERTVQSSIFDLFSGHEIGCELKAMSQWLDAHRDLLELVAGDLHRHGSTKPARGTAGGRCALLKQHRQLSYQELPSGSLRLVPSFWPAAVGLEPEEVGLAQDDQRASGRDLGRNQWTQLLSARQDKMESGKVVRVDSTVTAALIHEPSDSSLLWDCVRVMVRLLDAADALGNAMPWHDHCRAAKKRAGLIQFVRGRPKPSSATASCSQLPTKPWII